MGLRWGRRRRRGRCRRLCPEEDETRRREVGEVPQRGQAQPKLTTKFTKDTKTTDLKFEISEISERESWWEDKKSRDSNTKRFHQWRHGDTEVRFWN